MYAKRAANTAGNYSTQASYVDTQVTKSFNSVLLTAKDGTVVLGNTNQWFPPPCPPPPPHPISQCIPMLLTEHPSFLTSRGEEGVTIQTLTFRQAVIAVIFLSFLARNILFECLILSNLPSCVLISQIKSAEININCPTLLPQMLISQAELIYKTI